MFSWNGCTPILTSPASFARFINISVVTVYGSMLGPFSYHFFGYGIFCYIRNPLLRRVIGQKHRIAIIHTQTLFGRTGDESLHTGTIGTQFRPTSPVISWLCCCLSSAPLLLLLLIFLCRQLRRLRFDRAGFVKHHIHGNTRHHGNPAFCWHYVAIYNNMSIRFARSCGDQKVARKKW